MLLGIQLTLVGVVAHRFRLAPAQPTGVLILLGTVLVDGFVGDRGG